MIAQRRFVGRELRSRHQHDLQARPQPKQFEGQPETVPIRRQEIDEREVEALTPRDIPACCAAVAVNGVPPAIGEKAFEPGDQMCVIVHGQCCVPERP